MIFRKYINNSLALQVNSLLKFIIFFIFSIVLVKNGYTKTQIGRFEITIIITNVLSFFWVYGIIHSLMTLYNNNNTFSKKPKNQKSPEIFNAFVLLVSFNLLVLGVLAIATNYLGIFNNATEKHQLIPIILLTVFFSNPACLVEHIYVLRNKPLKNLFYGSFIYLITLILVSIPLILKLDVKIALWGIVVSSIIRFSWLIALLKKYAVFNISFSFVREHLKLAYPLVFSYFLSGSAEYIDNLIVSLKFNLEKLALFRYGAKELPFSSGLVSGLNSSLIAGFSTKQETFRTIAIIKEKSERLMHFLFPVSILILLFANPLYSLIYNAAFGRSSDVFMVYLLLITSRLLFPNTILIGLKRNKIVLLTSLFAIVLNVITSLLLIPRYGLVGVALATVIVYFIEKAALMVFVYKYYQIKPNEYTPILTYLAYTSLLVLIFVLIDWRIIKI